MVRLFTVSKKPLFTVIWIKAIPLTVLPCFLCPWGSPLGNLHWGLTYALRWPAVGRRGSIPRARPSAGWGGRWRWSRWGARPGSSPRTPETPTESPHPGTHSGSTHTCHTIWIFHRDHLNVPLQYHSITWDSSFEAADCGERIHNSAVHSGISSAIIPKVLDAHEECMTAPAQTQYDSLNEQLLQFYNKSRGAALQVVRLSHRSKVADETRDQELPSHSWISVNISEDELWMRPVYRPPARRDLLIVIVTVCAWICGSDEEHLDSQSAGVGNPRKMRATLRTMKGKVWNFTGKWRKMRLRRRKDLKQQNTWACWTISPLC